MQGSQIDLVKRVGWGLTKHETGHTPIAALIIFILFFIKLLPINKIKI